jgi:O-antigen ligase
MGFGGMDNNSISIAMVCGAGLSFFLGLHTESTYLKFLGFISAFLQVHTVMIAFSRGGMLALCCLALVAFILTPKKPSHIFWVTVGFLVALYYAGPEVQNRFFTSFAGSEERDESAQSRLDLWKACWEIMLTNPILGIGPRHFPLLAPLFGFPLGKEAHSVWLQLGAEQGFVGLGLLFGFYLLTIGKLLPLSFDWTKVENSYYHHFSRMVIAALIGFIVAGQFVSLIGLELPYYVVLVGAGALKLNSLETASSQIKNLPISIIPFKFV